MTFQTLVNNISFNSKGFDIVPDYNKGPILIIKNNHTANNKIVDLIMKLSNQYVEILNISTSDTRTLLVVDVSKKIKNKKLQLVFIIGGGSIIDFSKRVVTQISREHKHKIEFYIIPSKIGSGAESSNTSILNYGNIKNFKIDKNFIPDGVIYYTHLYSSLTNLDLLMGAMDAFMHCIESILSFNKNHYLNFLSFSSIRFIYESGVIDKLINQEELKENDIRNLCILSFNGGMAQNNSGAGICHALAHATEELTQLSHAQCISYYSKPIIKYVLLTNKSFKDAIDLNIIELIYRMFEEIKIKNNFQLIDNVLNSELEFNRMLSKARKDSCWRLFKEKIDEEILKKELIK